MTIRPLEEILSDLNIDQLQKTPNGFKGCCKVNPDHIDSKPSMHIHVALIASDSKQGCLARLQTKLVMRN